MFPAPRGSHWPRRYLPLVLGIAAFAGLAGTLLPMLTLTVHPGDFGAETTSLDPDFSTELTTAVGGAANLEIGVYDWFLSAAPVAGVIPIVFALAIAASVSQPLRNDDRRMWAAISALAVWALIVVAMTSIRPASRRDVTGPLARRLDHRSLASITQPAPFDVSIGTGFALAVVALIAVCGLSCWQYVMSSRRPFTP